MNPSKLPPNLSPILPNSPQLLLNSVFQIIRLVITQSTVLVFVAAVVGAVVGIFLFRNLLIRDADWSPYYGSILTSMMNAVLITALNYVYYYVGRWLTDFENHATNSSYENSLILKNFIFRFVNSYSSLFYIAFLKRYDEDVGRCSFPADEGGCLVRENREGIERG